MGAFKVRKFHLCCLVIELGVAVELQSTAYEPHTLAHFTRNGWPAANAPGSPRRRSYCPACLHSR